MNRIATLAIALAATVPLAGTAVAQEKFKAEIRKIDVDSTKTPDFNVSSGVKMIRSKPEDWIQVDVTFNIDSNSKSDFVDSLELKFYVLPKSAQKDFLKLYSTTVKHVDVLKQKDLHSAVYFSPTSLARMYGKGRTTNPNDLWVAVEMYAGGELVGGEVTDGKSSEWWRRKDVPQDTSMLRPKSKTPFSVLFYDAFAETRD